MHLASAGLAVVPPAHGATAAELTIYRRSKFIGSAIHPTVDLNGQSFVTVHNGEYFRTHLAPGHYVFDADGKSVTSLEIKAGEKYFMLLEVTPGFINGNGNLTLVVEQQAEGEIRELKPVDKDEIENPAFR